MRPARSCGPTWRPLPPIATSPGTARSATASCGSPWSPGETGSGERPGTPPGPVGTPCGRAGPGRGTGPAAGARRRAGARGGPGPKDLPRHDHRPDASASGQWHARSWQASRGVTVVTEGVFRPGDFTPPLQLMNLICAIARGWQVSEDRSVRGCPTTSPPCPGRSPPLPHRPAHRPTKATRSHRGAGPAERLLGPAAGGAPESLPGPRSRPTARFWARSARKGRERARERPGRAVGGPPAAVRGTLPGKGRPGRPPGRTQKRSRWTRRSPARSIRRHPWNTGMTPVGAGVRRVELWVGG